MRTARLRVYACPFTEEGVPTSVVSGFFLGWLQVFRRVRFQRIFTHDSVVDFLPIDRYVFWCLDAKTHFVPPNIDHRDDDVIPDDDTLVAFSRQHKHGTFLLKK